MGITYDSQPVTDFVASLVEGILKLVPMVSFNLSLVATRAQRLTLAHSYEQILLLTLYFLLKQQISYR